MAWGLDTLAAMSLKGTSSSGSPSVITRFAPSPTGHLHIGGVRTALFCWAYARGRGGHFMLRVEDTDQARSSESSARSILEDLAWCGIEWDEGPELRLGDGRVIGGDPRGVGSFYQAQRLGIYDGVISEMLERDLAYPAFDSAAEMEAMRKEAAAKKETFRYKRSAAYDRAGAMARMKNGEACVIRFNNPGAVVRVADEVLGDIKFEPEHTDDFVIRKADGFPTYHFAVVVDDETMGVTHVMRGQEHLNNTPRHVALQTALGYRTPVYAHLPLIFNMDGTKMSKRDKDRAARDAVKKQNVNAEGVGAAVLGNVSAAQFGEWLGDKTRQLPADVLRKVAEKVNVVLPEIDVDDFRRSGYLPEALCNFLALLGWNPGMKTADGKDLEKFDNAFLAKHFAVDRIGKTSSKFDRVKLASFNQDAIAPPPVGKLTDEAFAASWSAWMAEYEPEAHAVLFGDGSSDAMRRRMVLVAAVRPRAKTLKEAVAAAAFAMVRDDAIVFDPKAVEKGLKKPLAAPLESKTGAFVLGEAREALGGVADGAGFSASAAHAAVEALAVRLGVQIGTIAQALRVALTGSGVSPGIGETLAILGKQSSLARIDRCLKMHA